MHLGLQNSWSLKQAVNGFLPNAVRCLLPCAVGLIVGSWSANFSSQIFPIRGFLEFNKAVPSATSKARAFETLGLEKGAEAVRSPHVLLEAVDRLKDLHLGLLAGDCPEANLRKQMKVWIHPATQEVEIGLDSPFPHQAASILNAIIASLPAASPSAGASPRVAGTDLVISKVRPASPDVAPKGWPPLVFALAGTDAGFLLGLLFFAIAGAAERVRNTNRLEAVSGLRVTGSLPRLPAQRSWIGRGLTAHILPSSKAAAEIRVLVKKIIAKPTGEFLVTSASRGEGRSTVALNLAATLATSGHEVVLVDADLQSPALHQLLENGRNGVGLADALANPRAACSQVQPTHIRNLHILTAGEAKPGTEDQLADVFMENVLGNLRERFPYIVIDGGPLLDRTATLKLAARCQQTLLILEEERTRLSQVVECRNLLREQGVRNVAVLVNPRHRADSREKSSRSIKSPVLALGKESELPSFDWFQQKNVA